MELLYLNNVQIELPDRSVSQTLQINDVGDVKDRQANYSNSIKIPRTPRNILTMEMLGVSGNTTRIPYENVSVKYVVDGIELISEGKGIVSNTNEFYNLVIYDNVISMANLLGNATLDDLNYTAYLHTLNYSTFFGSHANTSGYIYAVGKFYEDSNINTGTIDIDFQSPSFYLHTLFDLIFTQKGYVSSGTFFTDAKYKERLISMSIGHDRISTTAPNQVYSQTNFASILEFFGIINTTKSYNIDSYTSVKDDTHTIDINGTIDVVFGTNAKLEILVNSSFVDGITLSQGLNTISKQFITNLAIGDVLDVEIKATSILETGTETISIDHDFTTVIKEQNINIDIDIQELIGATRQIDFVKDIMQRYGLIFRKVRNKKEFEFTRMEDLLSDTASAEDWSGKFSNFSNESYKPNYAQDNIFKFIYESEDTNEDQTFADGTMSVDNVNLATEKTVVTSIFKASNELGGTIPVLNHWKPESGLIVPNQDGIRIFGQKIILSIPRLDFEPVKYQNELDDNYVEFNNMLDDYKKITLAINLNLIDIYSIDFFKLKFFNQLGRNYYLNKIISFKKSKVTMCEFIEIG